MKKYIISVCITLGFLFGWTLFTLVSSNIGTTVEFGVIGYDPRNLLSGHYLTYTVMYEDDAKELKGINRFYIPEKYAADLDRALRSGEYDTKIKVLITPSGRAYVKEMFFDGVGAVEFAKNYPL